MKKNQKQQKRPAYNRNDDDDDRIHLNVLQNMLLTAAQFCANTVSEARAQSGTTWVGIVRAVLILYERRMYKKIIVANFYHSLFTILAHIETIILDGICLFSATKTTLTKKIQVNTKHNALKVKLD